jgi:ribosome-binding protein aMBF1 (putative translation factor)
MKKFCEVCGQPINGPHYVSSCGSVVICLECGEDMLVFESELNAFINSDDKRTVYSDDAISDISTYEFVDYEQDI